MSSTKITSLTLKMLLLGLLLISLIGTVVLPSVLRSKKDQSNNNNIQAVERSSITIVIDAGHGGEDGGTSSKEGVLEKDLNLSVATKLKDILASSGFDVVMTRSDDKMLYDPNEDYVGRKKILDMRERVRIASMYEDSIFVSIHMNAFPEEKYSGLQVYYSANDERSIELAQAIQSTVHSLIQQNNDRKIKCGKDIFLLDRIKTPAVLVECGFLSNAEEAKRLTDDIYQSQLAFCIFLSICNMCDMGNA